MPSRATAWIRRSVARQIVIASIGVVALISLAVGWYGSAVQREVLLRQMERRGQVLAETTAVMMTEQLLAQDYAIARQYLEGLVESGQGVVFAKLLSVDDEDLLEAGLTAVADPELVRRYRATVRAPQLQDGREPEPLAHLVVGVSTADTRQLIAERRQTLVLQASATFALLSLVLSLIVRSIVHRPLRALANQSQRIGRGDLETPIGLESMDEFGDLATALDKMRRDLGHSYREIQHQNEKLREIDRLKSLFLATMSHEIRTPMNGILGYSQLLLETDLDEQQRSMAETVVGSGKYLLTLINGILDLSKIEAGEVELEAADVDLHELVDEVVRILRPEAESKSLKLAASIDPKLPRDLVGDPLRIRQVTTNILGNAVKFTDSGVVMLRVEIAEESGSDFVVRVVIEDTGPGIDDELRPKLFQAFSQADASTTRRYGGTGLGLTIAKHLVELMGGSIDVEPNAEGGSRFWYTMRLMKAHGPERFARRRAPSAVRDIAGSDPLRTARSGSDAVVEPGGTTDAGAAQNPHRVLLVDDNSVNLLLARRVLTRAGYLVDTANDGQQAVAAVRSTEPPYDLILMDCQMPVMDGYTATRAIRALGGRHAEVPIIALTAHAMKGDRDRCLEAGMDDYIAKPFDFAELRRVLADWAAPHQRPDR